MIRLILVALAAAGAVWLADDFARIWGSDPVVRGRVELERWLRDPGAGAEPAADSRPEPAEEPREGAPEDPPPERVEAPPELAPAEAAPPAEEPETRLSEAGAGEPQEPGGSRPAEAAPAAPLSRTQAAQVRSRLGRVMTLAGGERR